MPNIVQKLQNNQNADEISLKAPLPLHHFIILREILSLCVQMLHFSSWTQCILCNGVKKIEKDTKGLEFRAKKQNF